MCMYVCHLLWYECNMSDFDVPFDYWLLSPKQRHLQNREVLLLRFTYEKSPALWKQVRLTWRWTCSFCCCDTTRLRMSHGTCLQQVALSSSERASYICLSHWSRRRIRLWPLDRWLCSCTWPWDMDVGCRNSTCLQTSGVSHQTKCNPLHKLIISKIRSQTLRNLSSLYLCKQVLR